MKRKIAIMASGLGSNALNLLTAAEIYPQLEIACVVVDTEHSTLPQRLADSHPSLPVYRILPDANLKGSRRKDEFERRVLGCLLEHGVRWILLAGYMRIIGPTLLDHFINRIVNIHPSLLPAYRGLHAFERAFADGVSVSGVTIHLVDDGLDTGPILLQQSFPRLEGDTLESFIQRGKEIEWALYPQILKKLNDSAELLPGA
jgi:phosphoribosylglycinamide formyltransferase 1